MYNSVFCLIIFIIFSSKVNSQIDTFKIYTDQNFSSYFKELNRENWYFYDFNTLKDSLTDGIYIFYNVKMKDSTSLNKQVLIKGKYQNFVKNGLFETYTYSNDKRSQMLSGFTCNFENGLKHGVEEKYIYIYTIVKEAIPFEFSTYNKGKLNGISIIFFNGFIKSIDYYEDGVLLKNEYKSRECNQ